jgi:glycosyltransferase involved in cell wall biosynthesis
LKKLKLGFDAKRLFNNFTGLGNYSRTLVRNLNKFYPELEIHLFTPSVTENAETLEFLKYPYKLHVNRSIWPDTVWRTLLMSKLINKLNLDVFHGLSHEIPFGIQKTTKTLVSIHDLIYLKLPHTFSWIDRLSFDLKYRSSANRADHLIAISTKTKEDVMIEYKIKEEKISLVYQACHDAFFDSELDFYDLKKDDYFLYVGSITERKSLKLIIEAYRHWNKTDRIPCYVIGNGRAYYREAQNLIRDYKLDEHFHFIGNIANDQLIGYYSHAKATILPSLYEGFGIPVIESLLCSTPVICTDNSALPEAAGPGAILIKPGDVKGLLDAMCRIMDVSQNRHMVKEGREYVVENFSADKTAKRLMEVYTAITNLSP